ncbi:DUF4262 domain-containing protein, partial [Loktanella sp. DJP18]|uniref:DUF4262 domain-containing protein n=1 Tax=Loktanella sp. DJP18 TaxID=3409788 RepID=UPI003BB67DC6
MTGNIKQSIESAVSGKVEQHGWTAISVHAGPEEPTFTYSVAFEETFSHPEVVLIGFDPHLAHQIISDVATGLRNKDIHIPSRGGRAS